VLDILKDNETVAWAVDKFLKVGLVSFLVYGSLLIADKVLGLTFNFTAGFGI